MKVFLLLAVCVLSLHNGKGAPRNAVYKFVKCNPDDDDANCVIQRTQAIEWSPDLPAKLPASAAQYLEAEPVEDESPAWEEDYIEEEEQVEDEELQVEEEEDEEQQEEEDEEDEMDGMNEGPLVEEESESPVSPPSEAGSGGYEGSAEGGSGESWTEKQLYKVGEMSSLRRLFPSKAEEQDLKQDHLLQL